MRTQVAIIGAGPAGLVLSHLLEQGSVDLLRQMQLGERMDREGLIHHGVELRLEGEGHRIPLTELSGGRSIMVYGQQEVVKDLIKARLEAGKQIVFEAHATTLIDVDSSRPRVRFVQNGTEDELEALIYMPRAGFAGVLLRPWRASFRARRWTRLTTTFALPHSSKQARRRRPG